MRSAIAGFLLLATPVFGEVAEVDEDGFVSTHVIEIDATPARVFEALTDEIGEWWDPAHTYTGDASNLELDGICRCEDLDVRGMSFVVHMRVDYWHPGKRLRLQGGLGPLQTLGVTGSMSFDLTEQEGRTKLSYRYVVGGKRAQALAEPVDRVQLGQLLRLARYVETGSPGQTGIPIPRNRNGGCGRLRL